MAARLRSSVYACPTRVAVVSAKPVSMLDKMPAPGLLSVGWRPRRGDTQLGRLRSLLPTVLAKKASTRALSTSEVALNESSGPGETAAILA
jgi:hypothetical protein